MGKISLSINIRDFIILGNYTQVDYLDEKEIETQNKVLLSEKPQEKIQNPNKIGIIILIIKIE